MDRFRPSLRFCFVLPLVVAGGPLIADAGLQPPPDVPTSTDVAPLTSNPPILALGRQIQRQTIERTVALTNRRNTPLRILKVTADCGCTTPVLAETELTAQGSTEMVVTFETRNYLGDLRRRIQLITDAGVFVLWLTIQIAPYAHWDITPLPLMLPPSLADQPARLDVTAVHRGPAAAVIKQATTHQPWLYVRLASTDEKGAQLLILDKQPGAPAGTHSVVLSLATNDPETPTMEFSVVVPVAAALRSAPNPIILPRVATGAETSATFRLIGWQGSSAPTVRTDRGTLAYLGATRGEHSYRLTWKPEQPGTAVWSVHVLDNDKAELDVPVILHSGE